MASQQPALAFTRRGFLGLTSGVAAATLLAACSSGTGTKQENGPIKFWIMPWGGTEFNSLD
jgi:multiple sugar transport system substrate-binding protein